MTQNSFTPQEILGELLHRDKAEKSLYEFFKQCWPIIEPGNSLVDGWYLGCITEHVQAVFDGQIKNLRINCPPRVNKTKICSIAAPAWQWARNPSDSFVCGSYAFTLARDSSIACRSLLASDWYQKRWGGKFSFIEGQDRAEFFANNKGGQLFITSPDSILTGRGATNLLLDDPNHTKDQSDTMLDATLQWWRRVLPTRVKLFKTAKKIVIQQRTHEKDISGDIEANFQEDFVHLILPMEHDTSRHCVTVKLPSTGGKPWEDPRKEDGELLCPDLIGPVELKFLKKALGSEYDVSGQLQQIPSPGEGGMIKKSWFPIRERPTHLNLKFTILSFDTALSDLSTSAYNAATAWGVFEEEITKIPNVILLSMWRERCEYNVLLKRAQRMAEDYKDDKDAPLLTPNPKRKPDMILIEDQGFGKELIRSLGRLGYPVMRFQPRGKGDKKTRVRAVQPLLEGQRCWLPGVPPDWKMPTRNAETFRDQCMPAGTQIMTIDGLLAIEDIKVGDLVLTHKGRFRPVTETMSRVADAIVRLKAKSLDAIELTPSHPVLAADLGYRKSYKGSKWVAAGDISPRKTRLALRAGRRVSEQNGAPHSGLCLPRQRSEKEIASVNLESIINPQRGYEVAVGESHVIVMNSLPKAIRRDIPLDFRSGRFFGLYLAEGCFSGGKIMLSFHKDETEFIEECKAFVPDRLGDFHIFHNRSINSDTVCIQAPYLGMLFKEFGDRAWNKKLPRWVWDAPDEFLNGFVSGWCDGDGTYYKNKNKKFQSAATASRSLAWQMRLILLRLGYPTSFHHIEPSQSRVGDKHFMSKGLYTIEWRHDPSKSSTVMTDDFGCFSVAEKSEVPGDAEVFNMHVAEDESYTTTGGIVHNCLKFPVASSRDLVDTMTQALYWLQMNWFVYTPDEKPPEERKPMPHERRTIYGGRVRG